MMLAAAAAVAVAAVVGAGSGTPDRATDPPEEVGRTDPPPPARAEVWLRAGPPEGAGAPAPGPHRAERDPWLRPFTSGSIWNTSIGSGAELVPAGLPRVDQVAADVTWLVRAGPGDPTQELRAPHHWRDRCHPSGEPTGTTLVVPADLVVPDARQNPDGSWKTPNNQAVVLQPDGRTLVNLGATCRERPGGPLHANHGGPGAITDLYGDGRLGGHGASGLSALGGAIRPGELTGDEPIGHVLDLVLHTRHAATVGGRCSRWPAERCDAYAELSHPSRRGRYQGANPHLQIGSLLALPPHLEPADLRVGSHAGRQLFEALQDHGGYWTEDSAWEAAYLNVDAAAEADIAALEDPTTRAEVGRMLAAAHVVVNNGPSSVGGGGTPRVPPPPELPPAPGGG